MDKQAEVLIIGGGIVGCAIAYFLRKARVEVSVFERDEIGGHASRAAAGLLAPLGPLSGPGPLAELVLAGFALLPDLLKELEELSGLDIGFVRCGALRVVRNPRRVAHLHKRLHNWLPLGLELTWLDGEEARHTEPHLAGDIRAAIHAPEEAQLEAPRLVQAFALAAQRLGARLYPQREVVELLRSRSRITGIRTRDGEIVPCAQLVLASGAWTSTWSEVLQTTLPISPLHGQLLTMPQLPIPLRHMIFGEGIYLAPRARSIIVGATREEQGFEIGVTAEGLASLKAAAARLVPALAGSPVSTARAGLRPKTADSRPIFAHLPRWENVLLAGGHNSIGLILSGITGREVAHMLITGQTPPLLQAFSLARFP
ncbi:MAG TPA: glycine oxidase ThiO [Acidobacteriaceae bacterium]|jgi:glycine oxidase|nr:glycine oxidase ThiO [Acidobacteriaceae bacterium]